MAEHLSIQIIFWIFGAISIIHALTLLVKAVRDLVDEITK